jgi:hypothetical protein
LFKVQRSRFKVSELQRVAGAEVFVLLNVRIRTITSGDGISLNKRKPQQPFINARNVEHHNFEH